MTIPEIIAELNRQLVEWKGHSDRNHLEAEYTGSHADEAKASFSDGVVSGLEEAIRLLTIHTLERQ